MASTLLSTRRSGLILGPAGKRGGAGPPGPPGQQGPAGVNIWTTALDFDFTTLVTQVIGSDGPVTLGGLAWTKENSAHESSAMVVTHGAGLVITPSTAGGSGYVTSRTSPLLRLRLSSVLPASVDFGTTLRIYLSLGPSSTDHTNNASGRIQLVGIDSDSTDFMVALVHLDASLGGSPNRYFVNTYAGGSTGTPNTLASAGSATDAFNKCVLWELDSAMPQRIRLSGASALSAGSSFPSAATFQFMMTGTIDTVGGVNAAHTIGDLGLVLTAGVQNGDLSFVTVVQRVRVDYR